MTNPNASYVETHKGGGVSFVGRDAVNLFRAISLKQALAMYAEFGMLLARNLSATAMLKMATEYTGQKYKRGQHQQASDDMVIWIETMKTALPIEHK